MNETLSGYTVTPISDIVVESVAPTPSYWWPLLLLVFGAAVLGVVLSALLGFFIGRRASMTRKTGGVLVLTLASIVLLTGVWCVYLSPTSTVSKTKLFLQDYVLLKGTKNVTNSDLVIGSLRRFPIPVEDRDRLTIQATTNPRFEMPAPSGTPFFHIYLRNPQGYVIRFEEWIRQSWYDIKLASGEYVVEIVNPNEFDIWCFVTFTVTGDVEYRPLESVGSWLALVSLPIFGSGLWATGMFAWALERSKERR